MKTRDKKIPVLLSRFFSLASLILFAVLYTGCSNSGSNGASQTPWGALVHENEQWSGETGCWEGYNQGGDPGEYLGLRTFVGCFSRKGAKSPRARKKTR